MLFIFILAAFSVEISCRWAKPFIHFHWLCRTVRNITVCKLLFIEFENRQLENEAHFCWNNKRTVNPFSIFTVFFLTGGKWWRDWFRIFAFFRWFSIILLKYRKNRNATNIGTVMVTTAMAMATAAELAITRDVQWQCICLATNVIRIVHVSNPVPPLTQFL